MKYMISKTFKADLAHIVETQNLGLQSKSNKSLINKCRLIHGHTVKIQVFIRGFLNEDTKMILDFNLLKPFKKFIDTFLDHRLVIASESKFPYMEIVKLFDDYYKRVHGCDIIDEFEPKLFMDEHNNVLAQTISTFSILTIPATTAEYMSAYLAKIVSILLDKETTLDEDLVDVKVAFYETETTYAETDFLSVRYWKGVTW